MDGKTIIILPEYEEEYRASEFVPFPSADDAIATIVETGSLMFAETRIEFFTDIIIGLREAIENEYKGI